jgi:DNA-directed RNA polymerase specialized sigma24 family protein
MTSLQSVLTDERLRVIQNKLVMFFARRNCAHPEDLAEMTISRVGIAIVKAVGKGEEITINLEAHSGAADQGQTYETGIENEAIGNLSRFFFGVARKVLSEYYRQSERARNEESFEALLQKGIEIADDVPDYAEQELQVIGLRCLRKCLQGLPTLEQEMIVGYYGNDEDESEKNHIENRKRWAERLEISAKALRQRARRRRLMLKECVQKCLHQSGADSQNRH